MKKLSMIILFIVGLAVIAGLVWLTTLRPDTETDVINRPATWTTTVDNELVIVELDNAGSQPYLLTLAPFGQVTFAAVGEVQTIAEYQLTLVSATTTTAQVLVSPKRAE